LQRATVTTATAGTTTHCIGLSREALLLQSANRFTRDNLLQSVCIEGGCSSLDPFDRDNAIPYCSVKFELPHYISSDFQ